MNIKKGKLFIIIGLILVIAAIGLAGYNLHEARQAEDSAFNIAGQLADIIPDGNVVPKYALDSNMEMPTIEVEGIEYVGLLCILELDLTLPVISEWNYDNLTISPCRYKGTPYKDNYVIAAHNYPSHFGKLNELRDGSEIQFIDVAGNIFVYEVALLETLAATDVEEMTSGEWDLSLFTCTIGGRDRVTIRCERTLH